MKISQKRLRMDLASVCRCCLAAGCYKQLSTEYFHAGQSEVYAKMLEDTFNLKVTTHMDLKQLICDTCINKLRDATIFKKMVVATEATLMKMLKLQPDEILHDTEASMKAETDDYQDDFDDTIDDHHNSDFTWDVGDDPKTDEKGQIFVIKLEPKEEVEPLKRKSVKVSKKPSKESKLKDVKKKPSGVTRKLAKIAGKSKERPKDRIPISESQIAARENSLKLILNSNLCLFRSLKTKFGCFHCKEAFMTMPELREHSKSHSNTRSLQMRINCLKGMSYRNADVSALACSLCASPCSDLDGLRAHLEGHDVTFAGGGHFLVPYRLEDGFKCVLCRQEFNTYTRMSIHMNTHYTNNVCEICGGSYINRLSLRMHVNAVHKEKKCSICSATFLSHYLRVKHMKKVHNTGQYKRYCLLCDKTFRYSYLLEEHRIQEHGVKRQISNCPECGKTFLSPQNLRIHIRSVHVKERNHPCAVCGMRFFTKCDQKRHERTHEDARSFACGFCEGRFKAKDSWRRHLRRQHPHAAGRNT